MKAWTYRQLTEATEEQLQRYVRLASEASENHDGVHVYRCMANGAYALWRDVTMGWQIDDSGKRLEALRDQIGKRSSVQPSGKVGEQQC